MAGKIGIRRSSALSELGLLAMLGVGLLLTLVVHLLVLPFALLYALGLRVVYGHR